MQSKSIIPVIIAGGVGSRLWPISRAMHPKPFVKLNDGQSLIQKTILRASALPNVKEVLTITNRALYFYTKDEYQALELSVNTTFITEPFGRNSAPAIALAAHYVQKHHGDDAIMLILPADHIILDEKAFCDAVLQAVDLAHQEKLVTFGIKPDSPKTGYGYIQAKNNDVLQFVEKPDLENAKRYLASGDYFWNAGMFCFGAKTVLEQMSQYCNAIVEKTHACLMNADVFTNNSLYQAEIKAEDFDAIEDISVDYALFEKSSTVAVIPCDLGWSDVGTWIELGQLNPKSENGNHIEGDVILEDVQNCIIHSKNRMVAGLGLQNLVIADTEDALLIMDQSKAQDVKKIVNQLKINKSSLYNEFSKVYRPWGSYTVIQEGSGFKIKRIEVKPQAALSLQSHRHRSEHWVVVQGSAEVRNGNDTFTLQSNESTFIPIGNIHRLRNKSQTLLIIIEVQCGSYLGEDDIIRYEDRYGRVNEKASCE